MTEFLCLANSWREGARCVAGVVPGRGWVRPVPDREGSAVPTYRCRHFRLLDVLDVDLGLPVPITGQPENVLLGPQGFSAPRERPLPNVRQEVEALLEVRPPLLERGLDGSYDDRVAHEDLEESPIAASLALVEPVSVRWQVRTNIRGHRRLRCHLDIDWHSFDLGVTDPEFVPRAMEALRDAPLNSLHPNSAVGIDDDRRLFLTVSLGGNLEGNHFKLVAGVIALDR